MKKSFHLLLLAVAVTLASCGNNTPRHPAHISAILPFHVSEPAPVALLNMDADGDTVATFTITDSILDISLDDVPQPFMARIVDMPMFNRLDLVVEPGEITIDRDGNPHGTPLNDRLFALRPRFDGCESEADYLVEINKAYLENRDNVLGKFFYYYVMIYTEPTLEQANAMLDTVPADYRTSSRITKLLKSLQAAKDTEPGNKFADFTVVRGGGAERLSDFVGRDGKYTLVDFWASWCGPCRREMPNLKELLAKHGDKLQIIGVAVWDDPDDTVKAIEELELPWHVMMGDEKLYGPTDLYGISGIPHIMLIDPQGKILLRGLQGMELAKAVDEALK